MKRLKIVSGSSHPNLAQRIAEHIGVECVTPEVFEYSTGCFEMAIPTNVRGCRVFIIQTSLPDIKAHAHYLLEASLLINAARKSSASEITLVWPYFSWARSDKKWRRGMGIAGTLFANLLVSAGMDRFVVVDLHSPQFEGVFPPTTIVDHLRTLPLFARYIYQLIKLGKLNKNKTIILPGDEGIHKTAEELGEALGIEVGSTIKTRISSSRVIIRGLAGDFRDKTVIIYDDEICTGGTVRTLVAHLEKEGAKGIYLMATHGVFNKKTITNLTHSLIQEIVVTDTLPIPYEYKEKLPLKIISLAPFLGEAIREIYEEGSISRLFEIKLEENL